MDPDASLRYLCMARKAGRLELGEEPVKAACLSGRARLVLLARDAAEHTRRRCTRYAAPRCALPYDKTRLGQALGRGSCAVLAVTDPGFAAVIQKTLAASDLSLPRDRKCNPDDNGTK